jgi:hypothetical protein
MRRVLATDRGGELYRRRQPMIEPVFAQMSSTVAWTASDDEARRRPREWRLITATHNLLG